MTKRAGIRQKAGRVTNFDGYKEARVSEKNWPTTVGMGEGDSVMIRNAVTERWPVRKDAREPLANMLLEIALNKENKPDSKINAARTVLTMEAQNQRDEHLIFQHENAKTQIHVNATVEPEQCRVEILEAIDAELVQRGLPLEDPDEHQGNGKPTNGQAPPKAS